MNHLANFDLIILFFALGAVASWASSDLEFPEPITKFFSIFLLLSIGLKGGHEVRMADSLLGFLPTLAIGLASCFIIPVFLFFTTKTKLGIANAAAVGASYGSVSAVTFITAQSILESRGIISGGYMVAVMALMEIPAIIIGVYLYQSFSPNHSSDSKSILFSIFSSKSIVLLVGGFCIGLTLNQTSWQGISPVVQGCFKGVLAFFLLDLGITAQKQLRQTLHLKLVSFFVAVLFPLVVGCIALIAGHFLGISKGDQVLIAVLVGSASYIAVPATFRTAVPEANASLYLALPLALTFPMNLIFGIVVYIELSGWL